MIFALSFTAFANNYTFETDTLCIDYRFTGAEAFLPGYAEGIVSITSKSDEGYCHLYWANESAVLPGYEEITTCEITSFETVEFKMPENMVIPEGATHLAVFFSSDKTLLSRKISSAELFEIPAAKRFNGGKTEMKFASVSDIHVNYDGAPDLWTSALNYFNYLDLELVVVSGDCTNSGTPDEWRKYTRSIEQSKFDADKIYVSRGNHDSQRNDTYIENTSRMGIVTPENDANSPWFYLLLMGDAGEKDNLFIFLAQELSDISSSHTQDNFSQAQINWFEEVLKEFSGTNTNIFVVEHGFFHNWGPGDRYDGVYVQPMQLNDNYIGNKRYRELLMKYKELIVMSGHSHIAFSEMVNFSDEDGSACRMIHNSSVAQPRVYNSDGTSIVYGTGGSEGYVVNVYENDIVYYGTNLLTRRKIPTACYIMRSFSDSDSEASEIFSDVKEKDWYYDGVKFVSENGLMNGIKAGEFAPKSNITRGMFVTVLYRLENNPVALTPIFDDVKNDKYYSCAVAWASENNIVTGITDMEFAPDNEITREQIATILYRYERYKNNNAVNISADLSVYSDFYNISSYAIDAMKFVVANNLINGKTNDTWNPKDFATRAELATILKRFVEICK